MPSIQARMMKFFMRTLRSRAAGVLDDLVLLRQEKERAFIRLLPPRGIKVEKVFVHNIESEWVSPADYKYHNKVILYLHGGGYAACSPRTHRGLTGKLATETGMRTLAINYRLAPEHPYPAALDDAMIAYKWLMEECHYSAKDIIIIGDSAGGGLSLSTVVRIREEGLEQPLALVLLSPWTDLSASGETMISHRDKEPLLPHDKIVTWGKWYAGETDVRHPLVSPVYADMSNLAPMLIHVGTDEILLSDSTRVAKSAQKAGNEVELDIWNGMPHVWHMGWRYIPESRKAIRKVVEFIERRIHLSRKKSSGLILKPEGLIK